MAANLVAGVTNFLAIAWFARELGTTVMGDYAVVITALQLVSAFLSAGFDQAVIREPESRELWAAANVATFAQSFLLLAASGLVYILYYLQSPTVALKLLYPAALVLGSMVVSLFFYLLAAPIAASLGYRYLSLARLASTLTGVGAGLCFAGLDTGIYSLAVRDLIAASTMLLLVRIKSPACLTWKANRAGLARLTFFAWGMWGLNVLERIALRLDYALVGMLLGKETLGMYFVVRGLVEGLLGFLVSPIQTVLYAYYCRLQDNSRLKWRVSEGTSIAYWGGCILLATFSYYVAPYGIIMLLGETYLLAHAIVPGLVLYAGGILWYENVKVLAMSQHWHHRVLVARFVQLIVMLIVIYPLTKELGIFGAGMASAAGAIALAISAWILTITVASAHPVQPE